MGRPVRVLWLIDSLTAGGAEALLPPLARAVDPGELELTVCALRTLAGNPYERELLAGGVAVTNLEARNLRDGRAFRRLGRLMSRARIEVVHAHLTYATIWGAVAARRARVPLVATLHTLPCGGRPWSRDRVRQSLMCRLLRLGGSRVLAVSAAVRQAYAAAGLLPLRRVEVLHNGIDGARFALEPEARRAARAALGAPPSAQVLVSVAVLRPGKGIETLLAALQLMASDHPHAVAWVAGGGPLRPELERLAGSLGVADRVRWLGFCRDVPRLLAAGDLFVLPSHFEAFPGALLEAMAAELPVVASAVGGIPEILGDPPAGRLVPPGSARALAAAVAALLDAPPAERLALGAAGRARQQQRFGLAAWSERLLEVYRERARAGAASAHRSAVARTT